MFVVTNEPKFTHDVKVMVPVDGGFKEQSFKATFRVLPMAELADDPMLDPGANQAATLRKVIAHLSDLVDDNQQAIEYSDSLRDQLIGVSYVRIALMQTYLAAVTKSKVGN